MRATTMQGWDTIKRALLGVANSLSVTLPGRCAGESPGGDARGQNFIAGREAPHASGMTMG
jgi:hypothetical protein